MIGLDGSAGAFDLVALGTGLLSGAVSAFILTVVIGGLAMGVAPRFTADTMERVRGTPIESFIYGIGVLLVLVGVTIVLVLTILGIFLAVPLVLLAVALWSVGAAIAYLAIGDRLVGHEDGWLRPLLLGAAIHAALTLSGVGGILSIGIGAVGFGAVIRTTLR